MSGNPDESSIRVKQMAQFRVIHVEMIPAAKLDGLRTLYKVFSRR